MIVFIFALAVLAPPILGSTSNLLSDIKAVYVYDNPENIDWGLIYHFAIENGCRVDLANVKTGPAYQRVYNEANEYNITASQFYIPEATNVYFDTIKADLFDGYQPDIVVFSGDFEKEILNSFEKYLISLPYDSTAIYKISKYFRRVKQGGERSLYIREKQYFEYFRDKIDLMADAISERVSVPDDENIYTIYDLIKGRFPSGRAASFFSGIDRYKFDALADKYIESGVQKAALKQHRNKYMDYLQKALDREGAEKIEALFGAVAEAKKFREVYYYQIGKVDSLTPVARYIESTLDKLGSAIFYETGIKSNGIVLIRETTEGKKLKFRSEISNNGYVNVRTGWIGFKPYWKDTLIVIDSVWTTLHPNNNLVREYTVAIDPELLETADQKRLEFVGRVVYGGQEMSFNYSAKSYEESAFSIEFVPDFQIIKPFPDLQIDRLVEPASLKAVLTKPVDFSGVVGVDVVAPKAVLAGAYKKELTLHSGERGREFNIPLVATRSMSHERIDIIINITRNGKTVASDIAQIRQADYDVPPNTKIALLPDVSGILEDILIETGADYKSISERYLKAGDLDLYDMVMFGTDCVQNYSSLDAAYDIIRKYMEFGGTVVVFGQPDDWRDDLLPVSIVSMARKMEKRDFSISDNKHPLFNRKYRVDISKLMDGISGGAISYPAVVFPGERIIEGENGVTLLSVSKFGEGKLIYCGLPLLQMIRNLDIDAIKMFSNLIHYSGK